MVGSSANIVVTGIADRTLQAVNRIGHVVIHTDRVVVALARIFFGEAIPSVEVVFNRRSENDLLGKVVEIIDRRQIWIYHQ